MNRIKQITYSLSLLFCFYLINVKAQELEPRALTNIPVGMNFAFTGYAYAQGNLLFDPALPIEDAKTKLHSVFGAYVRSINFFGLSGKIDAIVPYGFGDWSGKLTGIDTATSRTGFGDLRVRLSFNFLGAPALKANEFMNYKPGQISGFSLQIIAPTGQYYTDRLINLGSNRWAFKSQWGHAWNYEKWIWEAYVSAWFYTINKNFVGANEFKTKPLFALKVHAIRKLNKGKWVAFNAGYGIGARGKLNGELVNNRISTLRFTAVYAMPIGQHNTLRVDFKTGVRLEKGADFNAIGLTYQYRWIKMKKPDKQERE